METNPQELTSHLKAHGINWNWVFAESNAQDGRLVKREYLMLPAIQIKGACFGMKPSHQSPPNPVPRGVHVPRLPDQTKEPTQTNPLAI